MNFKRSLLLVLVLLVFAAGIFTANLIWSRPFFIDHFFERAFLEIAMEQPEQMSVLGVMDGTPFDFYSDKLTDASPAQLDKTLAIAKRGITTLQGYDRDTLSPSQQLSYDIFYWAFDDIAQKEPFRLISPTIFGPPVPYPIVQNRGAYLELVDFMSRVHRVQTKDDAENYLKRLRAVPLKLDQQIDVAKAQADNQIVPPRFIIRKTIQNLRNIRGVEVAQSQYVASFARKIDQLEDLTPEAAQAFKEQATVIVRDQVYPAYDRTLAFMASLEGNATNDAGVWKFPNGDAYYRYCVRTNTTTDLTPEEIHKLGLAEVTRIGTEVKEIMVTLGYADMAPGAFFNMIENDPKFLRPNTDEAKEQIVAEFQDMIDEINKGIGKAFNQQPKAPLEVRRVPKFRESTAASHYEPPSLDGTRPAIFFAELASVPPSWSMRTLAYHEGIPGHHFQIGLQQEQQGVPSFRKAPLFTAFIEGWALYAERLAWEMGYQDDPYDNLGRLQAELFRAVRLVVDTGLHAKRWTRGQAIEYMKQQLGRDETAEVERYIVWPGQALAYKVGMVKILALRERAKSALGDAFDIRAFHDVVIGQGAMPLETLESQVDLYIARESKSLSTER